MNRIIEVKEIDLDYWGIYIDDLHVGSGPRDELDRLARELRRSPKKTQLVYDMMLEFAEK